MDCVKVALCDALSDSVRVTAIVAVGVRRIETVPLTVGLMEIDKLMVEDTDEESVVVLVGCMLCVRVAVSVACCVGVEDEVTVMEIEGDCVLETVFVSV